MKKKRNGIVLAAVILLLAAGCMSGGNANQSTVAQTDHGNANQSAVIQTDHGRDYATVTGGSDLFREGGRGSLTIENKASFDVIIFAGKVDNNNVMGGIRSGKERAFDLRSLNLRGNGSFLIRAASFKTYNGKNNRVTEEDVLYSALVVYDLNDPNDKTQLTIFAGISETQKEWIYVSNSSKFVLEFRIGTPTGEKLATLAPWQENKQIFLSPRAQGMPYEFYPTYVYIDPKTNEVKSFIAKGDDRRWEIPTTERVTPITFTGPSDTTQIQYLVGFLQVKNSTNDNFVFKDGGTWLPDQKQRRMVATGQTSTFELDARSGDRGQPYSNLNIEFQNRRTMRINAFSIRPGWVYALDVTLENGNYVYVPVEPVEYKDKLEDMEMKLDFESGR